MSPRLKVIFVFTDRSLEFSEIANQSTFSFLLPAPLLHAAAVQRRRRSGPAGRPPPSCAGRPHVAPDLLHRPCLSAGALLSLPRAPETTAGRHIFVAVASSDRVPAALSFARIRTRRISSTYSLHYRVVSPPEHQSTLADEPLHRRNPVRRGPPSSDHLPSRHEHQRVRLDLF